MKLSDNRYTNRRVVREYLNTVSEQGFRNSRKDGWTAYIKADIHVSDRLYDREFPVDEFMSIVSRIANSKENEIYKYVKAHMSGESRKPLRINCYGYGNLMIGVTLKVFENAKSFHVDIRTCYAERNMVHRNRNVEVEKIWTRGMPPWIKNPQPHHESEDYVGEVK